MALKAPPPPDKKLADAMRLIQTGRAAEAAAQLRQYLTQKPRNPTAHFLAGLAAHAAGDLAAALAGYERAVALQPNFAEAHGKRGICLHDLKRYDEALACFKRAIAYAPQAVEPHYQRAATYFALGQYDAALESYIRTTEMKPDHAAAWLGRANALYLLDRPEEALDVYDKAIALNPRASRAHIGKGGVLFALHRFKDSVTSYDRALEMNPADPDALCARANVLVDMKRFAEAAAGFARVLAINPRFRMARGLKLHCDMHQCDWGNLQAEIDALGRDLDDGAPAAMPFNILAAPMTAGQQRLCAEIAVAQLPRVEAFALPARASAPGKLRIGYVSAEFHEHPVMHLIAGMFEAHDRSKFELVGISHGPSPDDPVRARVSKAFDRFIDMRSQPGEKIAETIRAQNIDIAVDLTGHTANNRLGIFAWRPAPVQIHFLGYPGSIGAPFIDYLVADPVVIPERERIHYSEKIITLPDTYQVNTARPLEDLQTLTRKECGLPDEGFVFCCFNNAYKITPDVFDVWMRVLAKVPGSVLWLLEGYGDSIRNLKSEAVRRSIAPERLVFAPRTNRIGHLSRQKVADLFLDTFHYNAHTTASDALGLGLPLVTKPGETFAARVAASLLNAIGMPELIAANDKDYEALAVELALDPGKLAVVKQKLAENISTMPLFDTKRFARNIEDGYARAWNRYLSGLPPDHIDVPAL